MAGLYFPHDINARKDIKVIRMRMTLGAGAYECLQILYEMLAAEPSHTLPCDYEAIAYEEHLDAEMLRRVVTDFDLFVVTDDGYFYSRRMSEQFEAIDNAKQKKADAGRKGAVTRWQTNSTAIANDGRPIANDGRPIANDGRPIANLKQCYSTPIADDSTAMANDSNININKINKDKLINNTSCGEQTSLPPAESYAEKPKITQFNIILNDKSLYDVTEQELQEWRGLYPAVDVEQELRNMHGWADANPKQRKTRAGIRRFITAWLGKAQNRAGGGNSNKSAYTGASVTFGDDNPMYRRD